MMDLFVSATATVRRMLDQGFQPLVGFRDRRWAHPDRGVADPITPPEGVVLDHLLYLDADTGAGATHFHSYLGDPIRHSHADGDRAHWHHPGEDRPSWPLGVVC
jgi:hypothetical protein